MSYRAMKKEMIHRFPITTTHITPICQQTTTNHEIIQSKNLAMSYYPQKEHHPFRNLYFPNTFPREGRVGKIPNQIVKGPGIKLTIAIKAPK